MTILTGILKDPFENPVDGELIITLIEPIYNLEDEEVRLPLSNSFEILDGIINIEIPESESYENNYLFEFIPVGSTQSIEPFPFYGVIPDLETIDLLDLVPIRKLARDLNEASFKVARLIARNEVLATEIYNLNPVGDYNNSTIYNRGDIVEYEGSSYVSIKYSSGGFNPLDTIYWYKLSTTDFTIPDGSITSLKLDNLVNASLDLADSSVQPADIVNFETTTQLNNRDIANRNRINHTGSQAISTVTGLQTALDSKQDNLGFTPENIANKNINNGYCGLDSGGKVPLNNLPSTLLNYQGVWNAATNTPTLVNPDLTKLGFVYNVTVAGTQFGISFKVGDWLIYNSSGVPEKSDNSDDVTSVNGQTGTVIINKSDVGLSNVVNLDTSTTLNITDSLNKRFITDAQQTIINNTSGVNTGDITLNTGPFSYLSLSGQVLTLNTIPQSNVFGLVSALAAKQDTLVSGTNIKTINSTSILGSGNIEIIVNPGLLGVRKALGSPVIAETYPRELLANATNSVTLGNLIGSVLYLPNSATITGVFFELTTAGNFIGNNENSLSLFSLNGLGTGITKIATTANDENIWKTPASKSVPFTSPIALSPGVYFVAGLRNASSNTTNPLIRVFSYNNYSDPILGTSRRLNFTIASQNSTANDYLFNDLTTTASVLHYFALY